VLIVGGLSTGEKNPVNGGVSTTVKVTVQVTDPAEFSAVIVTVCAPTSSGVPAAGDCVTTTAQPVVVTSLTKFGVGAEQSETADRVLSVAQWVIVGGVELITVTTKLHDAPSGVLHVTTVDPTGNEVPDAGLQVAGPQVPLVVGAG